MTLESSSMSYLVLARKYRPKNFSELVGQSHVVTALCNALTSQRLHHAYLFTGTRGVGKTTVSRILAKSLNCESGITAEPCGVCESCVQIDVGRFVDYTELDAASNRGVDEVQQLLEQAVYKPVQGRFKVFMIDEVHMLTNHAFNSMLKTLEEPPEYLKFVLATTDPQKVPVTVLSRCLQFNLRPMAPETILVHLKDVLAREEIQTEEQSLRLIAQSARGSMRDALSLTDQAIAFGGGALLESSVRQMLGSVDFGYIFDLIQHLANADGAGVFEICENIRQMGINAASTLEEMARVLQRMAVIQNVPRTKNSSPPEPSTVDPDAQRIADLAHALAPDETQLLYSMCLQGRAELGLAPDEYTGLTMILLRLLAFKPEPNSQAKPEAEPEAVNAADSAQAEKKTLKIEAHPHLIETDPDAPARKQAPAACASTAFGSTAFESTAIAPKAFAPKSLTPKPLTPKPFTPPTSTPAKPLSLPVKDMQPANPGDAGALKPTLHQPAGAASQSRLEQSQAPQMISVAVQSQPLGAQALEIQKPGVVRELVPTPEGDFWSELVYQLIESNRIQGLTRELALQSQLIGREPSSWLLRVESANLNAAQNRERLQAALQLIGHDVVLGFEVGVVKDSPARRNIAKNLAREKELLERIQNDPLVIKLVQEFDAKIIMGSIREVEPNLLKNQSS